MHLSYNDIGWQYKIHDNYGSIAYVNDSKYLDGTTLNGMSVRDIIKEVVVLNLCTWCSVIIILWRHLEICLLVMSNFLMRRIWLFVYFKFFFFKFSILTNEQLWVLYYKLLWLSDNHLHAYIKYVKNVEIDSPTRLITSILGYVGMR